MISDIPFQTIPRQSALFLSYLESSPIALQFYQQAPTIESLEHAARVRLEKAQFPRKEIASILRRQNESYGCDAAALNGIAELESPDCVAVLTGQQVGLFTGPLYTVYKALTAIHIAEMLKQRGIRAVPVFWMDTEDHDLPEVTRRTVLNPDSSLQTIDYRDYLGRETSNIPVGSIRFPKRIRQGVQDYLSRLPDCDGKADITSQLQSACRPGSTLAQSFAELMSWTVRGSGLILFDPGDAEAKRLSSDVFQRALREENAFRAALFGRNQELEKSGFHAQVKTLENSTVLFLVEDGERRALERRGAAFGLKNTDRTFTLDELLKYARRSPERFSPNVLLRPLVQDHLFPTIAYVGGSSELAYFAQIEVLYELYGRPMPVVWPRSSFTLIEPEVAAEMDRLGVGIHDCFQGRQSLAEKAVRNSNFSRAPSSLESLEERLDRVLTEVKPELQAVEPPLAHALETARRKIMHNMRRLKSQAIRFEQTRNSSLSGAVDLVLNNCYPNQNLQERELGIYHFIARHGPSLLDTLRSGIDVICFMHRIIRL